MKVEEEPLIDIRDLGGLLYGPPPECPETEPHYCLLRREVYQKLLRVQTALPQGCYLRLYEGLRSLEVQEFLFEQEKLRVQQRNPLLTDQQVHQEATKLVSPIMHYDGSPNIPPHSTGGAVDVEFVDIDGKVYDFGMEIKDWDKLAPEISLPSYSLLSQEALRNRYFLREVMMREGFVPYEYEWWHFSYGDSYWAQSVGAEKAIYGSCSLALIAQASRPLQDQE